MMYPLFLGKLGMTEVLIILVIVVIFFGGKKIPELMRGMGRGVREFKDAMEAKPGDEPRAGASSARQDAGEAARQETAGKETAGKETAGKENIPENK